MSKTSSLKVAARGALVAAVLASTMPAASAASFSFPLFSFSGVSGFGWWTPKPGGYSFLGAWSGVGQSGGFWGVTNRGGFSLGIFFGTPISRYFY